MRRDFVEDGVRTSHGQRRLKVYYFPVSSVDWQVEVLEEARRNVRFRPRSTVRERPLYVWIPGCRLQPAVSLPVQRSNYSVHVEIH